MLLGWLADFLFSLSLSFGFVLSTQLDTFLWEHETKERKCDLVGQNKNQKERGDSSSMEAKTMKVYSTYCVSFEIKFKELFTQAISQAIRTSLDRDVLGRKRCF